MEPVGETEAGSPCETKERGARVRFPPPLVFLGALVGGIVMAYILGAPAVPLARALRIAGGLAVAAAGVALVVSARVLFVKTRQSPIPWKPTPSLIFAGPYRWTRNPMYVGITTFEIGMGVAVGNVWISALAPLALAVVHFIAVRPEERYLAEKFGEPYRQYLGRVRRYL